MHQCRSRPWKSSPLTWEGHFLSPREAVWVWRADPLKEEPFSNPHGHQNPQCSHRSWANEITVLQEAPRPERFSKFPKEFSCATGFENVCFSPQDSGGVARPLGSLKTSVMVATIVIVTHTVFLCVITMGRRKTTCLCVNRTEQCSFETGGKHSWHFLKLTKTNHLHERDGIGTIYFNSHSIF